MASKEDPKEAAKETEDNAAAAKDNKNQTDFKTVLFAKGHATKQAAKKIAGEKGKGVGWWNDEKYKYSDKFVQDLLKQDEVPGVGGAQAVKSKGANEKDVVKRPKHKAKIQFKPSEALKQEAAKVNEYLHKLVVRMQDEPGGKDDKQQAEKSNVADGAKAKEAKCGKAKDKAKG